MRHARNIFTGVTRHRSVICRATGRYESETKIKGKEKEKVDYRKRKQKKKNILVACRLSGSILT